MAKHEGKPLTAHSPASELKPDRAADPLPEAASLLLDIIRFGLCLLVLFGHLSLPYFSNGWRTYMNLANAAVPGFFVLSGFVIRYVTQTRERDAARYFISRASRIYSVVLPAVMVTLLLDAVSYHVNPAFYRSILGTPSWATLPLRIVANLAFLTQSWGRAVLLFSDSPLWSLGYEVPYYVLFGLFTFLRGRPRVLAITVTGLLVGPQVLFLLPLWCSGLWLYDLWQWFRRPVPARASWLARFGVVLFACLTLVLLFTDFRGTSSFMRLAALPNPLTWLHQPVQRATMYTWSAGLLSFASLFLLLCASDAVSLVKDTRAARAVRFVAESTFTLYVFHVPLILFAAALHLYRMNRTADKLALMACIILLCIAASIPIERFKRFLRRHLFRRARPAHAAA